jgi:hypothetical protein
MKSSARLVNTSGGPIVVETALISALETGRIAGAAIDVFDQEPLPPNHPFRILPSLGDAAYRVRLARAPCALLPRHGQQYPAVAQRPGRMLMSAEIVSPWRT